MSPADIVVLLLVAAAFEAGIVWRPAPVAPAPRETGRRCVPSTYLTRTAAPPQRRRHCEKGIFRRFWRWSTPPARRHGSISRT